jgi:SAM-dependent methyltransferase
MTSAKARFVERRRCLCCGSEELEEIAGGLFSDSPLREFIENDPWGESPLPYIAEERWSFVRCSACSLKFHRRILSPEWNEVRFSDWMTQSAIEDFEDAHASPNQHFDRARSHVQHVLRLETQTRSFRGNDPVRVLDYGCGWGAFLAICRQFGFVAVGVDRSAARRQGGQGVEIFPELDDLDHAPEAARGFHAITLFEVLEHLDDPLAVLRQLSRHLVVGGILVLETPNCEGVAGIETEADYRRIHPLDHINGFEPDTLRGIAARAGFAPIRQTVAHATCDPLSVLKSELKRFARPLVRPSTRVYFQKSS